MGDDAMRFYGDARYFCENHGELTTSGCLMRCPICGRDVRVLFAHLVKVRDDGCTYLARSYNKRASCTAGPEEAARAVARKLFGDRPFTLKRLMRLMYIAQEEGNHETKNQL